MPLITISRGIGCGGMLIAKQVAEGLHLDLYNDRKLDEEAFKKGLKRETMDEKAPGFLDRIISDKPLIYLDLMESLIYEIAKKGEGVIIGHGSQMLLRDFECALHVRIHAGEATRIENLMKHKGLSANGAENLIRTSDHQQKGFFRFAFHLDWTDPALYDLVINTEQLGIDTAAKLIMEAARSETIKSCGAAAVKAMDNLALKKRVEAVILANAVNLMSLHIEVPEQGVVEVSGFAESEEKRALALAVIRKVKGVKETRGHIGVVDYSYV